MTDRDDASPGDGLDMDDVPESTGMIHLRLQQLSREGAPGDRVIAKALGNLVNAHQQERGASKERARWAWVWRALGTLGFAIASGLGTYALNLASNAAADHDRLARIEAEVAENLSRAEANDRETRSRLEVIVNSATRIETIVQRLEADAAAERGRRRNP